MQATAIRSVVLVGVLGLTAAAFGGEPLLPPTTGIPEDFAPRRAGAEVGASWRIAVTNEGVYRLTQGDLVAAGIDPAKLVGSQIRLFCRTQELAIYVSSGDGLMNANDYVLFYGLGFNGYYTTTNVYWLGFGSGGRRMETRSAAPIGSAGDVVSAPCRVTYDRDLIFNSIYRPADGSFDHWFASFLTTNSPASNFVIRTDNAVPGSVPTLDVTLDGLTTWANNPDHQTRMTVSGVTVTNFLYDGQVTFIGSCGFAASLLNANSTTVSLRQILLSGVSSDTANLEKFALTYLRSLVATDASLTFGGQVGAKNYVVSGFNSNSGFWLLDVSDPSSPVILKDYEVQTNSGYRVRFGQDSTAPSLFRVCNDSSFVPPLSIQNVPFRNLASIDRQADYIVICPYQFRSSVYRLLSYRYLKGFSVVVAPVTDIYNEFSYGITDAAAIQQFLGFAFHHWRGPQPKYVVLGGGGTYDPKDNLLMGKGDAVPVHMGPSAFLWTSLDGWYAAVKGDDKLPDMAVGRIPADSNAQFSNVVSKTIAYEALPGTAAWRSKCLVSADNLEAGLNFKSASLNYISPYLTNGWTTTSAYLDDVTAAQAKTIITNQLNSGIFFASYFGHGGVDQWATENILRTNDVITLTNSILPILAVFTCQNGSFHEPKRDCIAEAILEYTNNRGAVAVTAPSGLSIQTFAEQIANYYFKALVEDKVGRIGNVMTDGGLLGLWNYNSTLNADEMSFYEVFGDPALVVNPSP